LPKEIAATITGTVADPAGAIIANAPIEARNAETGVSFRQPAPATGNYTLSQLPTGTYELSLTLPGFKKYVRQNIALGVAQTLRIDIGLRSARPRIPSRSPKPCLCLKPKAAS